MSPGYMGSKPYPSPIILLGLPLDITSSWRPGARMAPGRIREVSWALEEYSPRVGVDLGEVGFSDLGDVDLPPGNVERSLEIIRQKACAIVRESRVPVAIGGEHLVTLPIVEGLREGLGGDFAVLQLDAHADLRDDYLGERLSHATVMRRVYEATAGGPIYQVGIRSGIRDEFEFASRNTRLMKGGILEGLARALGEIGDKPVYVTLDMDVVDPGFAPGVGTPEPGGQSSRELLEALLLLRDANIVGFDLVEVNPQCDPSDVTSLLAAKVVREVISILSLHCPG